MDTGIHVDDELYDVALSTAGTLYVASRKRGDGRNKALRHAIDGFVDVVNADVLFRQLLASSQAASLTNG